MNRDTSTIVAGRAFGPRWERVPFDKARIGVPSIPPVHVAGSLFDSALSYAAAQALRWWFLAEAARDCSDLCLETRLVEHRCKFTWEEVQIRALNETDGFNRLPKAVGDG